MWCPEGFVLLGEIEDACAKFAELRISGPEMAEAVAQSGIDPENVQMAYAFWCFARFIEGNAHRMYAALPNGKAVRLAPMATETLTAEYDEFHLDELFVSSLIWLSITNEAFLHIESEFHTIDTERDKQRSDGTSTREANEKLRPLQGCPVCFKPTLSIDKEVSDFLSRDASESAATRKPGRRKIRLEAARLFRERYPDGLPEGVSFTKAAELLGYDRKTLRAGLKEYGEPGNS